MTTLIKNNYRVTSADLYVSKKTTGYMENHAFSLPILCWFLAAGERKRDLFSQKTQALAMQL